ncbi:exodeoxyribonuclease VII large subunit [Halobellus clavatus]|uniref:Uncharacterized protein n=1 Tax=Halobellus clavatus TaxID=660517 RepID=A0A1H3IAF3_9EURY|nr:exodeoxyribonuclease VII large subunit [Halobellus clavatus]SDY24641.1 hypothetical protein SAMN04487946_10990 [Halobellus clavatus]
MADAPDTERQAVEPDAKEVLSVSQLKDRIASIVQDTPALNGFRCIGEVTDFHQNSTTLYFTLRSYVKLRKDPITRQSMVISTDAPVRFSDLTIPNV